MARELSPLEAYILSEVQKEQAARDFQQKITDIYHDAKAGKYPAVVNGIDETQQRQAVEKFVAYADEIMGESPSPAAIKGAIKRAYHNVAMELGLKQVNPDNPEFESDLNAFYKNYKVNFAIKTEQETKKGFRDELEAPVGEEGCKGFAYNLICPITGNYLMGGEFAVISESNSIHFTYGFVMPEARGNMGFSRELVDLMRKVAKEHIQKYPTKYKGDPMMVLEKNQVDAMLPEAILMDSAHIDIHYPPRAGTDLSRSAMGQSMRDYVWDRMGAQIIDFNYMQPSLDGAVIVEDEKDRQLAIRYLNKDATLTASEKAEATNIIDAARGDKMEGCTTLDLCAFMTGDTTSVNAKQVEDHVRIFSGRSVIKDPANIKKDIYYQAQMESLKNSRNGVAIATKPIKPFGMDGVGSFKEAEDTIKAFLNNITWEELQSYPNRTYAEWIKETEKAQAIKCELAVGGLREAIQISRGCSADTMTAEQISHLIHAQQEWQNLKHYNPHSSVNSEARAEEVHGITERIKEELTAAGLKYGNIKFGNTRITETKLRAAELEAMNGWNTKQSKGHSR